jgi:hippurate hydrolase
MFQAGTTDNVIPQTALLRGTVRTFKPHIQDLMEKRLAEVASQVVGSNRVDTAVPPVMGAEDFSFMLEARPGAFIFIGNGDSAGLHHPAYNFNDEVIPVGTSYWVKLVETALRA